MHEKKEESLFLEVGSVVALGFCSPGTVVVHAAYTSLTDTAVMRSGRSVGFATTAHRPAFTALETAGQQGRTGFNTKISNLLNHTEIE